jgi:hypothetical protein
LAGISDATINFEAYFEILIKFNSISYVVRTLFDKLLNKIMLSNPLKARNFPNFKEILVGVDETCAVGKKVWYDI